MEFSFASVRQALRRGSYYWRQHALERLIERNLRQRDVVEAIVGGEAVEEYSGDCPFPSALILGWVGKRPIHAVVAWDAGSATAYIITVYVPDADHFEPDYRTRRT
jgi:hypothetical protein